MMCRVERAAKLLMASLAGLVAVVPLAAQEAVPWLEVPRAEAPPRIDGEFDDAHRPRSQPASQSRQAALPARQAGFSPCVSKWTDVKNENAKCINPKPQGHFIWVPLGKL